MSEAPLGASTASIVTGLAGSGKSTFFLAKLAAKPLGRSFLSIRSHFLSPAGLTTVGEASGSEKQRGVLARRRRGSPGRN